MSTSEESGDRRERIAKVIARAGLCSRREAEEWIAAGRVAVNGTTLDTPAHTVGPEDRISVDGAPLPTREPTRLWLYHKPRGLVTTNSDPEGRPTVFERLPEDLPRVMTIGRLDINTEGLLLLTNDGGLARVLELPATGWLRRYRARAHGEVTQPDLDKLQDGVAVDGVLYGPIEATLDRVQGANAWLMIGLREGKNREVKQVLGSIGLEVSRLIRISFGPFQLGDLEPGEVREIRGRILRDQLGERLAEEAGCEFPSGRDAETRPRKSPARKAPAQPAPLDGRGRDASGPSARPSRDRPAGDRPAPRGDRRGADRPLHSAAERPRGMVSRGSIGRDEGRARGSRSHDGDAPRRAPVNRPENPNPRVLAPTDWTGEFASEGPAPKKEDRPPRKGKGAGGAGARGDGPRSAGPRSAGSRGDSPRGAAPRSDFAAGADERPKPVPRPPRGHSVWRADDAGGRPMRPLRDPSETGARPPRDAADRPARPAGDRPARPPRELGDRPARLDADRPLRRSAEPTVTGWTPPQAAVTATDKPSRRMAARARDAAKGEGPASEPARAPRRESADRSPYAGRPRSDERPAPRPRGTFPDRPPRPSTRTPRDAEAGDRPARPYRRAPPEAGDRPARPPREYGDRPPRRSADGPARPPRRTTVDGAERPARAPRAEGERTYKPRAPRADGDRPFKPRAPRAEGERPFKARAPRAEGDRPTRARPPRAEGERSYTPRPPRAEGDRPTRARPPRAEGDRPTKARPPRADGDRPFKPRAPRAEGAERPPRRSDGPSRPPGGGRPPRAGAPTGAAGRIAGGRPRPAGDGPRGKPSFGSDRPRPSGPPKGRPPGGPKGRPSGGPKGGSPKGRPSGGAPRGRPRDGQ
jgi:23S rRNA pseudouridine2605 synthase